VIAFDLECSKGHRFEGWFNNLSSFEEQSARKLVSCPICSATRVKRVLSPVTVKNSARQVEKEEKSTDAIDYPRLAREIVDYIHNSFDDVGGQFAREALKMHYGVTEKKNIRGSATVEEEKMLKQEKIEFFKLPVPASEGRKKKN
jgi:hypothetical protein